MKVTFFGGGQTPCIFTIAKERGKRGKEFYSFTDIEIKAMPYDYDWTDFLLYSSPLIRNISAWELGPPGMTKAIPHGLVSFH